MAWADLIRQLAEPDQLARLDMLDAPIVTSVDPSGENNDYNHFLRKGPDGWVVLADLEGPGYISRFWFTGAEGARTTHGLRFYFDDEPTPRIDTTLHDFCGGAEPNTYPLARYESYCWAHFIPVPFRERVVVMVEEPRLKADGQMQRLFYQINHCALPAGQTISSYTPDMPSDVQEAIASVRSTWMSDFTNTPITEADPIKTTVVLEPWSELEVVNATGPGLIREWRIAPLFSDIDSPSARERLLRDVVIRAYWDGQSKPSVEVPLGDFFGSFWHRTRFASMFFGMDASDFVSRFPMPFEKQGRLTLENQGKEKIRVDVKALVKPMDVWDDPWGYLHATWQRTEPSDTGRPHPIARVKGRGKYVGCVLAVTSLDQSWWILEGDETIRKDEETQPGWLGTGLEDYFNGGWYYQNALARPLYGVPFKAPFRTVQYRHHLIDPVMFTSSIDVLFERGPDHASRGWMESVGYFYLEAPQSSGSRLGLAARRVAPDNPLARGTLMTELCNHERLGDYQGAHDYIDLYLERYPDFPFAPQLRLRKLAYVEALQGMDVARPLYEAFIGSETNEVALQQARDLLWFHEDPSNALLGVYCNMDAGVYLDGKEVGRFNDVAKLKVARVTVSPGQHVVAVRAAKQPYPDWFQCGLRTHAGLASTSADTRWNFAPTGAWTDLHYEDQAWKTIAGTGNEGPPEGQYIWMEPNGFIDMQSQAFAIRPQDPWPEGMNQVGYRFSFQQ